MKKGLVLVVMCVAMLFAAAPSASAQAPSDEYKAILEKMLELSGSMASAKAMVPQMISMLKQQSSASVSFWDGFQKKWEGKFGSKLAELYAPVYQKYLTLDDFKDKTVEAQYGSLQAQLVTEQMPESSLELSGTAEEGVFQVRIGFLYRFSAYPVLLRCATENSFYHHRKALSPLQRVRSRNALR